MTPEQRSSAVPSSDSFSNHADKVMKGGMSMKVKNNTDAPQLRINWKHLFLVALHLLVLILHSFNGEFVIRRDAARALP